MNNDLFNGAMCFFAYVRIEVLKVGFGWETFVLIMVWNFWDFLGGLMIDAH